METSSEGIRHLKIFEGFKYRAYKDTAGFWTIGYGTKIDREDEMKYLHEPITEEMAEYFLKRDVITAENAVLNLVSVPLEQWEFDALVSFVYNLGSGKLATSTLLRQLNAGMDKKEVAKQFERWVYSGGKVTPGLVKRREAERDLFLGWTSQKKK